MTHKLRLKAAWTLLILTLVGCSSAPAIRFDLPEGWTEEETPSGDVLLVHEQRRMSLMLASLTDPATRAKYELPCIAVDDALRQTLIQGHGPMALQNAPGQTLDVQPVPGSAGPAQYFILETSEGRFMTVGLTWLDGTEVTMLGSGPAFEDVQELLTIMASVRGRADSQE